MAILDDEYDVVLGNGSDAGADARYDDRATRKLLKAPNAAGDDASADLGIRRIQIHEKNAWMLTSHLE